MMPDTTVAAWEEDGSSSNLQIECCHHAMQDVCASASVRKGGVFRSRCASDMHLSGPGCTSLDLWIVIKAAIHSKGGHISQLNGEGVHHLGKSCREWDGGVLGCWLAPHMVCMALHTCLVQSSSGTILHGANHGVQHVRVNIDSRPEELLPQLPSVQDAVLVFIHEIE